MTSYWFLMRTTRCSDTHWLPFGRNPRFATAGIAVALLGLSLGGCIPFATPHLLQSNSRGDVTTATQQRLEVGKSTRADVLLALGAPDGRAADDSWFTYGSARTSEVGGFLFLIVSGVGAEHVNTHVSRLLVRFDSYGIVSNVDLQQSECSGFMAAQGCLDLKGKELTAADGARAQGYGSALLSYPAAQFRRGTPQKCEFTFHTPEAHGPLVITDRAVVMGDTALDYTQIEQVLPVRRQELDSWVALKGRDGICTFIFIPEGGINAPRVHDAILHQWQVVSGAAAPAQ
jgi:hypothetical protein